MPEIQKGDRRARHHVMMVLGVSVLIALLVIALVARNRSALEEWIDEDPPGRLRTFAVFASLGMLPLAAAGTWVFNFGRRIVQAERFPPPGTTVVRDTVVLRGPAARRRGRLLQALAMFLIGATAAGVAMLLHLVSGLGSR